MNPLFVFRGPTSKGKGGERIGVEGKGRGRRGEERRGVERREGVNSSFALGRKIVISNSIGVLNFLII